MSQHRHRKHRDPNRPDGQEHTEPQAQGEQPAEGDQAQPTVEGLQAERDDLLGRLQRVSADYLNYQKRIRREMEQAREYAHEDLMKAMLGVLDDLERALEVAATSHGQEDPIVAGVRLVLDKAVDTLGRFGLKAIEAEGQKFDPQRHAAMMQEPRDDVPPMTVLRELQRGYELKSRTLRPAAVVVAQASEAAGQADGEDQADQQPGEQQRSEDQ